MKKLQLPLMKIWFEMTKASIKTEDYREINEYWARRFISLSKPEMNYTDLVRYLKGEFKSQFYADNIQFKKFDINRMTLGYPKNTDAEKIIEFEHLGIEVRTGKLEWGAELDKLYFVIKHRIKNEQNTKN